MTTDPPAATEPSATPAAEVTVDTALVSALLRSQHPDLAGLPVTPLDAGWDNAMFRLGDHLAVRLPRRAAAAGLIRHEQLWLPRLADLLPLPIPAPRRVGHPEHGYPWHWSVLPWIAGAAADLNPPSPGAAPQLATFLRALHVPAPEKAPRNPFRGIPLGARRAVVEERLQRLRSHPALTDAVRRAWQDALDAPSSSAACWVHGDLHARNVLTRGGDLAGIIDWGDLCAGDPATDLAAVWMLLDDARARREAIQAYGSTDPAAWRRAGGWAVSFGAVLLETGLADMPRHAVMGEAILRRLADDYSTMA